MLSKEDTGGSLAGRRIVIVGAGQNDHGVADPPPGNGRAISLMAAREGAQVTLVDREAESLHATARLIREEGGVAHEVVADVAREDDVVAMVEAADRAMGGIDGLALVVGIAETGSFDQTTVEEWDHVFDVNVRGHFLCLKHAWPRLAENSSIVLVSSIAAVQPIHDMVSYHASKSALEGLKHVFGRAGAKNGIRVNIVGLGYIDTAIGRWASSISPERRAAAEERGSRIPMGRQGTAWEVAAPITFLLSDAAGYITGQSLFVDGGQSTLRA